MKVVSTNFRENSLRILKSISVRFNKTFSFLRGANFIFTPRGLLLFVFAAYLLAVPSLHQADIIASVVSLFLLISLLFLGALSAAHGRWLRSRLTLSFSSPSPSGQIHDEEATAGIPHESVVRISQRTILPFFVIEIVPVFEHQGCTFDPVVVTGSETRPSFLPFRLHFPHRGIWKLVRVECLLRDRFHFTAFRWDPNLGHCFRVKPQTVSAGDVPAVSSCHRSGDVAIDLMSRAGDPFDLKRYHPSDGMKKILWKVYAKSRQLISRHPEASFTPEGQVAIYVVAEAREDAPCSAAVAYMRMLEELDLELFLSASSFYEGVFARSSEQAVDMLIESAWEKSDPAGGMMRCLAGLERELPDTRLDRLIIFASLERLTYPDGCRDLEHLADLLSARQISPLFVLRRNGNSMLPIGSPSLSHRLLSWLLWTDPPPGNPASGKADLFYGMCMRNNWEIFTV